MHVCIFFSFPRSLITLIRSAHTPQNFSSIYPCSFSARRDYFKMKAVEWRCFWHQNANHDRTRGQHSWCISVLSVFCLESLAKLYQILTDLRCRELEECLESTDGLYNNNHIMIMTVLVSCSFGDSGKQWPRHHFSIYFSIMLGSGL